MGYVGKVESWKTKKIRLSFLYLFKNGTIYLLDIKGENLANLRTQLPCNMWVKIFLYVK